jgi:hypothetical protein
MPSSSRTAIDAAFDCSGNAAAVESALKQLRRGGTLVLVGTGMARPKLDTSRMILGELTLVGSYNYDEHGIDDALALLAGGKLPTAALLEGRRGSRELGGAMGALRRRDQRQAAGGATRRVGFNRGDERSGVLLDAKGGELLDFYGGSSADGDADDDAGRVRWCCAFTATNSSCS